ncbi:hypothetical protein DVZ84_31245 [Streptomyces parvulus]|uniref:Uncharacterized protein n=1 Tax=Streptomyces parvulus TaxID=146923 RepID=A0A369UZL7_9ACTN|nr:hypothetical protein DVZ84_31245 [Streptomyces parvulus]
MVRQTPGAALHWRGPWAGPPPRLPCCDRTVGLVQRASRADGSVPSAEIRHPWFGRRPACLMPWNERGHATAEGGAPVNSSLRAYRGRRVWRGAERRAGPLTGSSGEARETCSGRARVRAEKTGRSVGGIRTGPRGGFHHNPL